MCSLDGPLPPHFSRPQSAIQSRRAVKQSLSRRRVCIGYSHLPIRFGIPKAILAAESECMVCMAVSCL